MCYPNTIHTDYNIYTHWYSLVQVYSRPAFSHGKQIIILLQAKRTITQFYKITEWQDAYYPIVRVWRRGGGGDITLSLNERAYIITSGGFLFPPSLSLCVSAWAVIFLLFMSHYTALPSPFLPESLSALLNIKRGYDSDKHTLPWRLPPPASPSYYRNWKYYFSVALALLGTSYC